MRRSFITLYAIAATALTAVAQPRFTSNTETYDFGQIEWKHPVTVQYSITNTGDRPLVLTEVEPDCACSVAQWTKTPIVPGAKGTVNVTFDAEASTVRWCVKSRTLPKPIHTSSDRYVLTRTVLIFPMYKPVRSR